MRMKKMLSFLLIWAMSISLLAGCESKKVEKSKGKEKVVVALWGNQMLEGYTQYLCDKFPDVDFKFELATNSTDYYRFRQDHEDLPDILTVRRFSLKDAVLLKDYLYDLGDTELASTYYRTYLDNYTYNDGTVNWLPACAEVDSFIINETLFEEYNIPIPTDYDSFIAACEAFEKVGIKGYVSDFDSDFTCMEVLQGMSVSNLLSMEGREWRQQYESGSTNQLSEEVWMPVFEKFYDMKDKVGLGEEAGLLNRVPKDMFTEGKAAMYRGTGADVITFPGRGEDKVSLLPYFGNTESENWYLTYPAFQVAASNNGMDDPEREKLILDIMTAMLNQEGQEKISYGKNMIPYNKNVTLELLPELENLKPYIKENKMYIRLASNDMFRVSQIVVQQILKGELKTPRDAFNAFNSELKGENLDDQIVAHIDTAYSNEFTTEHGNQAASAICNTMREEIDVDVLFGQSCYIASDIYEGDYTEKDLEYLSKNDGGWPIRTDLTGEQLYQLVEETLSLKLNRGAVCNDSTMYVSSGFEMDVTKTENGYTLNKLTQNGKDLDRAATYSVVIYSDRDWYVPAVQEIIGFEVMPMETVPRAFELIKKRLMEEKKPLAQPTDYITIN
ncbi:MAG: extracellular solute-binding protein [Lachnospiraceae bacterium]